MSLGMPNKIDFAGSMVASGNRISRDKAVDEKNEGRVLEEIIETVGYLGNNIETDCIRKYKQSTRVTIAKIPSNEEYRT